MFSAMPPVEVSSPVIINVTGRTRKQVLKETADRMVHFKSFAHIDSIVQKMDDKEWELNTVSIEDIEVLQLTEAGEIEVPSYDRNADPDEDPNLAPEYWARLGCQRGESLVSAHGDCGPQVASMDLRYSYEPAIALSLINSDKK